MDFAVLDEFHEASKTITSGTPTLNSLAHHYTTVADTLAAKVILPGRRAEPPIELRRDDSARK